MPNEKKLRRISVMQSHGVLTEIRYGPRLITSLPRHCHAELQIVLSEDRLISYDLKGAKILSPLGSVFVIEPECPHSAQVEKRQDVWGPLRTFLIPRDTFQRYLGLGAQQPVLSFRTPLLTSLELLARLRLTQDLIASGGDELAVESQLTYCLRHLLSLTRETPPQTRWRRSAAVMHKVRELLGDNLSHPLSLWDIALSVGLSPFHLLRTFKAQFGLSPHAFRTQVRIWRARDLLAAGLPICDVAQETGFSDQAHLTRTFHRIVGVPPGRYETAISFKTPPS